MQDLIGKGYNMQFKNLEEVQNSIQQEKKPHHGYMQLARQRQESLTKPSGSLGKLEDVAVFMAGWLQQEKPYLTNIKACIFAGNHGIVEQGVSCFPPEVTAQMVANFKSQGAAINQLCTLNDINLDVIPLQLERPVKDFTKTQAMSEGELIEAINMGAAQVDKAVNLYLPGEMGIGNTTSASAICYLLYGGQTHNWIGKGTGVNDEGLNCKSEVLAKAHNLHAQFCNQDPLKILQSVGGREIAAILGLIIAARHYSIPVLLDGFIVCAAAAIIHSINNDALSHCLAAHLSNEKPHIDLLKHIQQQPLLDLEMRLGEASGAAVACAIIKAALITHNNMATFAEAQVATKQGD